MVLTQDQLNRFLDYLRSIGKLKTYRDVTEGAPSLLEDYSLEDLQAFLALIEHAPLKKDFQEFVDLINFRYDPGRQEEYQQLKDAFKGTDLDLKELSAFLFELVHDTPTSQRLGKEIRSTVEKRAEGNGIIDAIGFGANFGIGMGAGFALKTALAPMATSLTDSVVIQMLASGAVGGGLIGGAFGTYNVYKNLSAEDKAKGGFTLAFEKGGYKGALVGAVTGSAGATMGIAFGAAAVSICGSTFLAASGLGAFTGLVIGLGTGIWRAYDNLSADEKALGIGTATLIAIKKDHITIAKSAALGLVLGAAGGAIGWGLGGFFGASAPDPTPAPAADTATNSTTSLNATAQNSTSAATVVVTPAATAETACTLTTPVAVLPQCHTQTITYCDSYPTNYDTQCHTQTYTQCCDTPKTYYGSHHCHHSSTYYPHSQTYINIHANGGVSIENVHPYGYGNNGCHAFHSGHYNHYDYYDHNTSGGNHCNFNGYRGECDFDYRGHDHYNSSHRHDDYNSSRYRHDDCNSSRYPHYEPIRPTGHYDQHGHPRVSGYDHNHCRNYNPVVRSYRYG